MFMYFSIRDVSTVLIFDDIVRVYVNLLTLEMKSSFLSALKKLPIN